MIIGKDITEEGKSIDFELDITEFKKTHTFLQAMTGHGKTNLILELVDGLRKKSPDINFIFFDDQEEYTLIPKKYKDIVLVSKDRTPKIFTTGHAFSLGKSARKNAQSLIIKLTDFKKQEDKELYVQKFLEGFKSLGKDVGEPFLIVVDEADLFVPTRSKRKEALSRAEVVHFCKRGRKYNAIMLLATQYSSSVDIDARRECENYFIGRTKQRADRNAVCEMLGDKTIFDNLGWGLDRGQFYVRGLALSSDLRLIQTKEAEIEKRLAGVSEEKSYSDLSKIYEESVTGGKDLSLIEMLQKKIEELEKELTVVKSKELTDEIRKHLIDMGFNEGLKKAKEQYEDDKGKLTRFMEKL